MTRMYTRRMRAITLLVEDARRRYLETSRPNVVVHTAEQVSLFQLEKKNLCQELTIAPGPLWSIIQLGFHQE